MDQRQPQADRNTGEADRGALGGAPEDDGQEEERHQHFHQQAGHQAVLARAQRAVAVGGEAAQNEVRLAGSNHIQDRRRGNGADNLCEPIGDDVAGLEASGGPKADRNGRVEMAAGDMSHGIGHGQHRQAERQRHADEADPKLREGRGQHGAAAAGKGKPEGSEEFRADAPGHVHVVYSLNFEARQVWRLLVSAAGSV